jgi:2-oxoglutarate ferredoxin oxidoreductase subunit alpha
VLWEEDINRLNGEWSRYLDVDGDGIPYRTIPGNRHPRGGYFNRGTGHDENARYTEDPEVWERVMNRLCKKYQTARSILPEPILRAKGAARAGIIAYGSSDPSVQEAQDELEKAGFPLDYLRVRAIPFNEKVEKFIQDHEKIFVVENNRDGQLCQLLTINFPAFAARFKPASHMDGMPLTARWIRESILAIEED